MSGRDQLSLFGGQGGPDPVGPVAVVSAHQRELAARLSDRLYLGASSWTFPGWAGVLYAGRPSMDKLVTRGLEAYAKHPLLRTASVDRSYYAPLTADDWRGYARQLPPSFRAITKAWNEVTTAVFPAHARWGDRAGQVNPRFLDPELTMNAVVRPYLEGMGALAGPLVLEMAPIADRMLPNEDALHARMKALFASLPRDVPVAVELRTPRLFTPRYLDLLRAHRVAHVHSFWSGMPTPGAQAAAGADDPATDLVFRILQPPGSSYEALRDAYTPFDRLHAEQPDMRRDVVALSRRALDAGRRVFVIVGNKAEGCAPLSLFALAEALADKGAQA